MLMLTFCESQAGRGRDAEALPRCVELRGSCVEAAWSCVEVRGRWMFAFQARTSERLAGLEGILKAVKHLSEEEGEEVALPQAPNAPTQVCS